MTRGRVATRHGRGIVAAVALVALAASTGVASAHSDHGADEPLLGDSTLEHTVIGGGQDEVDDASGEGFSLLRLGAGEPHVVREELARGRPGRAGRRRSLIYLTQLTDFQLADEQSPARVEFLDPNAGPVSSAWRPQEALVPYQVELTIRQVNEFLRSPIRQAGGRRARMANAVLTGDLADNQHQNETEWVVQLLEGGVFQDGRRVTDQLDPGSGDPNVDRYPPECREAVEAGLLDPADAERYVGVQDYDDYPGGSTLADRRNFYDPSEPAGAFADWPTYDRLLEVAQRPFAVEGLDVPSYVAFGNHDLLVQGNQWANAGFDDIARGCVKVFPAPGAESFLEELLGAPIQGLGRDEDLLSEALRLAEPPARAAQAVPVLESFQALVPPDADRRLIDRPTFRGLHDTGAQPDAHGFALIDRDELRASNEAASYYDFSPRAGVRYIVLDTVSHGGQFPDSSTGNVDHPQFEWLGERLDRAERRDELVLVFAHHAIGSLTSNVPDEAAPPCGNPSPGPGCDLDPRDSRAPGSPSPHQGADLEALLHEHPSVLALIAGHSHENRIQPLEGGGPGGEFWEIKSPAIVDWPPQHRLIEVMDNRDGTLSIFGTLLDDASSPRAPRPAAASGGEAGEAAVGAQAEGCFETADDAGACDASDLASIGRTLSYNDPQVGPDGAPGERPQGVATDRNVELLIADPRERASEDGDSDGTGGDREPGAGGGSGRPAGDSGSVARRADLGAGVGSVSAARSTEELPFTGLALVLVVLVGAGLAGAGTALRGRVRPRPR